MEYNIGPSINGLVDIECDTINNIDINDYLTGSNLSNSNIWTGLNTFDNIKINNNIIKTQNGSSNILLDVDDTICYLNTTQILTNKTIENAELYNPYLISPIIASNTITTTGGHFNYLQEITDTYVMKGSTDTLTNKTLTNPILNNPIIASNTIITISGNINTLLNTNDTIAYQADITNLQNQITTTSGIVTKSTISNFIKYLDNSNGLCFSITTDPYFKDNLSFTSPVSSHEIDYTLTIPITITNTISGINCIVKKNGVSFATPTVYILNNTLPISYSVTMNGSNGVQHYEYEYNQYFCNANINFLPTYENATNTYTIYLGVSGSGHFIFNSTISTTYHL